MRRFGEAILGGQFLRRTAEITETSHQIEATSPPGGFLRTQAEILWVAMRLGITSFGGPVAHLGYFREEYVARRKWLDEAAYADLVALCQFLPGPASSQVGIAVGMTRGGLIGGALAWLGFTLPSAIALILFAYGIAEYGDLAGAGWLSGLKVVAVAVIALAVWGMARSLCPDRPRATIAVLAAVAMIAAPTALAQVGIIVIAGLAGLMLLREGPEAAAPSSSSPSHGKALAIASLFVFFVLLALLPVATRLFDNDWLQVFDSFYRTGSLVFGGGHVVLPLIQAEVVPPGWVSSDDFIAGYGAAQAVPGPLFTFAAFLGTAMTGAPGGWSGGLFALAAIFLPSFLLVTGVLPFWESLRRASTARAALRGVNAGVVGLLVAALYQPVWTSAIHVPQDFALGIAAFLLLAIWKWPPWLVVLLAALAGAALGLL